MSQVVGDIPLSSVTGKGDAEVRRSLSGCISWIGGTRTNATVAPSRSPAASVALCRSDDIWHRLLLHVGAAPLLMLVQTVRLRQQPPNALMQLANRV